MPDTNPTASPLSVYQQRLEACQHQTALMEARAERLSTARLLAFLLLLGATGFALWSDYSASLALLAAALLLLVAAIVMHERQLRRVEEARRRTQYWSDGLDRLRNRWAGKGVAGAQFLDPHHLYADDLDLFGPGSLFELLCSARTSAGETQLAAWLTQHSSPADSLARQQAVRELCSAHSLREDLAMLGPDVRALVHPHALKAWVAAPARSFAGWERTLSKVLPALLIGSAIGCFLLGLPFSTLAIAITLQTLFAMRLRPRVLPVLEHVGFAARDLEVLSLVLRRFEAQRFEASLLRQLRTQLEASGASPGERIRQLSRLSQLLDSRLNQAFGILAPMLLWSTNCAMAIERWRTTHGPELPRWLQAVGELEALCSLARYAFEHPTDAWPTFHDGPALLEAHQVGHPLIDEAAVVRNSVRLDTGQPMWIVSGSNMSGKSTLLRAVGMNLVLAKAGAPVRAAKFVLSPFQLGASIRVSDNLLEGESRFYAEIRRIRDILDLALMQPPALFLLDEIFSGTNSHDRRIGAQAILRSLVQRGALGLVTTHDLALTQIDDALGKSARNVHFEDQIVDGRMRFDYRMRDGVVTRSNALELMRSIGIEL
jgi:ABC-type iron transport system FetAB ATPase subunit